MKCYSKKFISLSWLILFSLMTPILKSQEIIPLLKPDLSSGMTVMTALSLRASSSEFDTTSLKLQDLSDLLWAANGINRPESGKRTAPSAMNARDIDVYAFMKSGSYLYDAKGHVLNRVAGGDNRSLVAGQQLNFASAPVMLLLVSDVSRFPRGDDSLKVIWAAEDAGIVSQNISLFCASAGLLTRPRASMDQAKLRELLKLKDTQYLMLNNPVGYRKE